MAESIFSRAAQRADHILMSIADKLNGNTARRRAIKQKVVIAMLAAEQHHIVAARAAQKRTAGIYKHSALLHWRAEFHRNAV